MIAPILLTGCARSGTSMTGGIMDICGAFGGKMSGPTKWNQKGMFENEEVRNRIVKPYLESIGMDPMGQMPLPDVNSLMEHPTLRNEVEMCYKWQGYRRGPWFYKGAKMCLIWPIWHTAFPDAKWVIVRRADEDIIYSCMRTNFMRKRDTIASWQEWVDEHKKRFQEMKDAGLDVQEVWPTKFVAGDFEEIKTTVKNLGLEWTIHTDYLVTEFINPQYWKESKDGV